ncbi:ATP-binding protein [Myxococcota bacterium]|nr:ATP-binding protein [Myxococcota bacterium]
MSAHAPRDEMRELDLLEQLMRREATLRASEQRLMLALAAGRQDIFDYDIPSGRVLVTAERSSKFGSETATFAVSRDAWFRRLHDDDREAALQALSDYLEGRTQEYRVEYRRRFEDGTWAWIHSVGRVIERDADGRPIRMIGTHTDISDRKRAHAEQQRMQASLAQSDRLASMGMLAAGVAHEINNPLAYVLFTAESLAEDLSRYFSVLDRCTEALTRALGPDEVSAVIGEDADLLAPGAHEETVARVGRTIAGLHRIRDIVRGLGTFARVESADLGPIHVERGIENALLMAQNEIKYRAKVVRDFSPTPAVLGSDGKIAQIFLNLLINSAHAIEPGHVDANEITVRTWVDGDRVHASVTDTGKGIPREHWSKLWDPFFTTKGVGLGSGLGLPICRGIVQGLGGEIAFTSEVGRGTTFTIALPKAPPDALTTEPEPSVPDVRPLPRGRVFVVDDEPEIREVLARELGRDHELVTAASGEEARAILGRDAQFDVLYCDLMMPRMSGMELHAWIARERPELAARVVFMSGGAFTSEASQYLAKLPNRRIDKPFDRAAFRRLTAELIRGRS